MQELQGFVRKALISTLFPSVEMRPNGYGTSCFGGCCARTDASGARGDPRKAEQSAELVFQGPFCSIF